ncbi:plasmid pRiA4b ORF-3 family protein [Nitrosomonas sp.]|uniref:plasmid pRiA4b ORF-3 family protein n=1 Tax=Nitrosomonas sp. TaxID=42353 RepID=UPI0025E19340|nr:plasmid pRiA4b ORF-3 family protein [Nitrosomonas sp.]
MIATRLTAKSLRSIYQLKVTLKGMRPPIWRRILVASTTKLDDIHLILQIVMGWTNSHLHEFIQGRDRYGEPDEDFPSDAQDETRYRLDQILKQEKGKLIYLYDFGDGWEHEVVLEKILPFETSATLPICLKGRRACPPEDIGGIGGYMMFLDAISDPAHPEHEVMLEWIAEDIEGSFDPETFDLAEVNQLLQS